MNNLKKDCISRKSAIEAINDLPNCDNGYSDTYDKACIIGVLEELEPKPCDKDCISRQATVERLCKLAKFMNEKRDGLGSPYVMAALFIQDNKDEFPSVTPHESVTEFADRCRECGREKVLDKIRAEILEEKECAYDDFERYGMERCIDILDKYKAESEGKK